jgi:hypothetical protein
MPIFSYTVHSPAAQAEAQRGVSEPCCFRSALRGALPETFTSNNEVACAEAACMRVMTTACFSSAVNGQNGSLPSLSASRALKS